MTDGPAGAIAKLARMANQIAHEFRSQPQDEAAKNIAAHIKSFWTPKMRRDLIAHTNAGGAGVEPLTKAALARLS